jgi:uncharacterized membrane protein YcaP (DUF421 family)
VGVNAVGRLQRARPRCSSISQTRASDRAPTVVMGYLEGSPDVLISGGEIRRERLDEELITLAELEAAARRQGIRSIAEIEECRLETGGALTFVAKTPTPEDTQHREVVERLEAIERRLEMLTAR